MDWRITRLGNVPYKAVLEVIRGAISFEVQAEIPLIWQGTARDAVMPGAGSEERKKADEAATRALWAWTIRRVEAGLKSGVLPGAAADTGLLRLEVNDDDTVLELSELVRTKVCNYQAANGRDLFCRPARSAPTSKANCSSCIIPDEGVVCSELCHATGMPSAKGLAHVEGAVCGIGSSSHARGMEADCAPWGNSCWRRVTTVPARHTTSVHAAALPDAIDFMDTTWRLVFGDKTQPEPLLGSASAASLGQLTQPCGDRDEFQARVSALKGVLDALLPSDRLKPGPIDVKQWSQSKSLARITRILEDKLASDPKALAGATDAIDDLKAIARLRDGTQHSDARSDFAQAMARLDLDYPPADWSALWDQVRSRAVAALSALRSAIRTLAP